MDALKELVNAIDKDDLWLKNRTLKRNEVLVFPGEIDTKMYFVLDGSVRIFLMDDLHEHTIRFGYQGSFLGALDSFITDSKTLFTIQALKQTTLKVIRKEDFMNLIEKSFENQQYWQTILMGLVHQQMEREVDLLTTSPQERYARVLARSPQLFQEIPHKYIASYLRMTPETLSRIKKRANRL